LIWTKRPKIQVTIAARRRIWSARNAGYRVVESRILYGDYAIRVTAERFTICNGCCGWDVISTHRSVRMAKRSAEAARRAQR
jgi:hypothetical protein